MVIKPLSILLKENANNVEDACLAAIAQHNRERLIMKQGNITPEQIRRVLETANIADLARHIPSTNG